MAEAGKSAFNTQYQQYIKTNNQAGLKTLIKELNEYKDKL